MFFWAYGQENIPLQPGIIEKVEIRFREFTAVRKHLRGSARNLFFRKLIINQNGKTVAFTVQGSFRNIRIERQKTALVGCHGIAVQVNDCFMGRTAETDADFPSFPFCRHEKIGFIPEISAEFADVLFCVKVGETCRYRNHVRIRKAVLPSVPAFALWVKLKLPHAVQADFKTARAVDGVKH